MFAYALLSLNYSINVMSQFKKDKELVIKLVNNTIMCLSSFLFLIFRNDRTKKRESIYMNKKINFIRYLLAISCGVLVANIYYAQPIAQFISKDLNMSCNMLGLLGTLTQIGYALELFFLVPMGDLFKNKSLIVTLMGITTISLFASIFTSNGGLFLLLATLIGIMVALPISKEMVPIKGVGIMTAAGFIAEVGDIKRFTHPCQIQKLAGLNLIESSSGKHKGKTSISKRGRARLRALLFSNIKNYQQQVYS